MLCKKQLRHAARLLPFLAVCGVGVSCGVAYDLLDSWPFVSAFVFLVTATFLYTFPWFVRVHHTRPVYIDEAFQPQATLPAAQGGDAAIDIAMFLVNREETQRAVLRGQCYANAFMHATIFLSSVGAVCVVDYTLYRYQSSPLSALELAGISGGVLALFGRVHKIIGSIILRVLRCRFEM